MPDLYRTLWPALRLLRPETVHGLALKALKLGLVPKAGGESDDAILAVRLWNQDFTNPIGLAAGFDKEAAAISDALSLGFGFVEPGTVTPLPQPGNPKPRLFRLDEDDAAINRLGFNNGGIDAALPRATSAKRNGVLGINVGVPAYVLSASANTVTVNGAVGVCFAALR